MRVFHRVAIAIGITLMTCSLGGCGSISSFVAGGMADLIPTWAGGLPADAPPRPGTLKYDEYIREREQKMSAVKTDADTSEAGKSEAAKSSTGKTDIGKTDTGKNDTGKSNASSSGKPSATSSMDAIH